MRHSAIFLVIPTLICASPCQCDAQSSLPNADVTRAGPWTLSVTRVVTGPRGSHVLRSLQTIYRQGPTDRAPVKLYEQETLGTVIARLRDDGLVFLQGVGGYPRLYFPDGAQPIEFRLPSLDDWPDVTDTTLTAFSPNSVTVEFLGDVLFYAGLANSATEAVGIVRVDAKTKRITENRVYAVYPQPRNHFVPRWYIYIDPYRKPIRIDRFVFWSLCVTAYRDVGDLPKPSDMGVLDLTAHKTIEVKQVPEEIQRKYRAALEAAVKQPKERKTSGY